MYYVGESRVDHILYIVVPSPSTVLSIEVGSAVVSTLLSTKPIYRLFCSYHNPVQPDWFVVIDQTERILRWNVFEEWPH